jgi:site-specific DNA recombinase
MLLSFAQFEREIAGERIRDKIAASKRKGRGAGNPRFSGGENYESNALTQSRQMPGHSRVARRVRRLMKRAGRLARQM